ncbi:MAG: pyridoxamine 5'-phosphate oxidase [Flavobacteriales bacterium]
MSEINKKITHERRDFEYGTLEESQVPKTPKELFESWFKEALDKMVMEPYAFHIATVSKDNTPSTRVVYLRSIEEDGFVFFTNYNGKKGQDIAHNPNVCANFFWAEKERQIRIYGVAVKIDAEFSDAYFAARPRESQLGAWASHQSEELNNHNQLADRLEEMKLKFADKEVPRPPHWGGFIIKPTYYEFWQGRAKRLHDRITYKQNGVNWEIKRINP